MKKYLKKSSQNGQRLENFKSFEIPVKLQFKLKGGSDYIGIEDLING